MKLLIICKGFKESNINKQPWKYIDELSKALMKNGHEVLLITDEIQKEKNNIFKIITEKDLFSLFIGETNKLLSIIESENPDKCIMLLGLSSFLRREFKIKKPVIGIFTSPVYSIKDLIKNIGFVDLIKYRKYTLIHIINSLVPNYFIKKFAYKFERIVFLSNYTCNKIVKKGFSRNKSLIIPSGIDENFLNLPNPKKVIEIRKIINPENLPLILYFTSPLTLRGTDTLIKAFGLLNREKRCKLIFLSRIDYSDLKREEKYLKEIAEEYNVLNSIEIISDYLTPGEIKIYLSSADVVCLPFKIVISDTPLSILEAMALKKPVISTDVASVPELLSDENVIVKANNVNELKNSLLHLLNDENLIDDIGTCNRIKMEKYPTWNQIAGKFEEILE